MKAFPLLILAATSALAQESAGANFDLRGMDQPMTIQELVTVVGFLAVVGGGVFLAIRLRGSDKPPASLNSRHYDERERVTGVTFMYGRFRVGPEPRKK